MSVEKNGDVVLGGTLHDSLQLFEVGVIVLTLDCFGTFPRYMETDEFHSPSDQVLEVDIGKRIVWVEVIQNGRVVGR